MNAGDTSGAAPPDRSGGAAPPDNSGGAALYGLPSITIPLRSRRQERGQLVQKIQHVIPAMTLFVVGMQAVQERAHGAELALAVVQLVTSAGLVLNFMRQARALRRIEAGGAAAHGPAAHEHHGVDWFEIFAAGVIYAEALEKWHLKHRIARPAILMGTATLLLGLFHGRLAARIARHRVLRVDDHGIRVGGKFWRTFDAPWADIAAIDLTPKTAEIRTRHGRTRRLRLDDLYHGDKVRRALNAAREQLPAPPA